MRTGVLLLIARQFCMGIFKSKAVYLLISLMAILLFYAAYSGVGYYHQNHFRIEHQEMARKSWEANPDKHPHRMAHFGTFAFRLKHPLSIFDFGIESFTGNAVFLEAHKQNMVNFSEASFSTGLLRFGELSMAMILQTMLPLIIFFIGYSAIVADRENGTLKILLTQGARWKEILFGKSLGLMGIAMLFCLPFLLTTMILLATEEHTTFDDWGRFAIIVLIYVVSTCVWCLIAIAVSAGSQTPKSALIKLLGIWMLLVVLLPRTAVALGAYFHQTPTKLAFRAAIEEEVLKQGDSHNPNDPHFSALKDSVLRANNVASTDELPFNYGGFVMSQGEKINASIYSRHQKQLLDQYRKQNQLSEWLSIINPYLAVKYVSMALTGTDFESYVDFQRQAESYRYKLTQKMNELQMKYIDPKSSSSEGKINVVDSKEWRTFPDFHFQYLSVGSALRNEVVAVFSIIIWALLSISMIIFWSKRAKAI